MTDTVGSAAAEEHPADVVKCLEGNLDAVPGRIPPIGHHDWRYSHLGRTHLWHLVLSCEERSYLTLEASKFISSVDFLSIGRVQKVQNVSLLCKVAWIK